ncbi:23S rRNA (pseudouridine(1915)-N(3))-methyltransferase RlmH [Alphaproteobacteria bacterium]|nr:23S rRNA (pseudouridine(1915)-N(3))-methyltransferase RlmH [Alphaproteobacteria bacterium]
MLNIKILTIGKNSEKSLDKYFTDYISKTPWNIETIEIKSKKIKNISEREALEGKKISKLVGGNGCLVALEENGIQISSKDFSKKLYEWQYRGIDVFFLIGGPNGLSQEMKKKANLILSFGKMTWPHKLVKILLSEQLYRASTILNKHPYHRE